MKKILFSFFACALIVATCACNKDNKEEGSDTPAEFSLDSYNGAFVKGLSDAYETFEKTGSLPATINVEGLEYNKGRYILAGCMLMEKIFTEQDTWQQTDIDIQPATFGDEYRWNTFDPDVIDMQHVRFMAGRLLNYALEKKALPNYVTFPSDDTTSPGYLPQLTMVVTKHDNLMNLRACMIVPTRVFNYFVKNEGEWPEEVSSWPSTYLSATRNCPIDDPVVIAARDAAIKGLPADATDRQKAEAIYYYARDNWTWENYQNTKKGAVGTINAKAGNCCDLTHATIAMCRATGIPARYLHGQCYFGSSTEGEGHLIPEIYVDGKWWICDPYSKKAEWGKPTWKGMETFNGRYYELEF